METYAFHTLIEKCNTISFINSFSYNSGKSLNIVDKTRKLNLIIYNYGMMFCIIWNIVVS